MIGKKLAHYQITKALGRGGMGEVYLAQDEKLGRLVALKLLPDDFKTDPARRARFEREAQTVAALNHPNVVILHAVEEADNQPFLVMEYVEGKTLDEIVPATGLSMARFLDLALPLTEAVAAAHAKGITHRDLKPQNVMTDSEGRLKVLDFGLAKLLDGPVSSDDMTIAADSQMTRDGVIMGTAAFMSPEQAEGKMVDARSDVFSLGILLYRMITGRQPFEGETQMSTMTAVLRDDPQPVVEIRPDLPRHLGRIIRRCLEKDPDRRYDTARGIHYDLDMLREEIASGEHEVGASAQSAPASVSRPPKKLGPVLGAAAVVALIIAGVFWLKTDRQGGQKSAPATEVQAVATAESSTPTIVVFPFENLGPPEDAYFAAGITDEIVTSLTGIEDLRVVSRTSAMHYDRTDKSMPEIAADLGVDFVLEGSVRWQKSSDGTSRVRVTPQLMDARTDQQVWASRYDRSMEEIFKVQTEIANEVVSSLGVTLALESDTAGDQIPTQDMSAYHAYLRAKDIVVGSSFRAEAWFLATDLLEKAVASDPSFHAAWVYLARANSGLCHFDWDRSQERLAQAKTAADRAMALDPHSAYSHMALGGYYYWGLKDYDRALVALEEADRIRPNDPLIMETLAYVLRRMDSFSAGAEVLLKVAKLSPQDPALCYHLSETLAIIGRYEEAVAWIKKGILLGPDQPIIHAVGSWVAIQAGWSDQAREFVHKIPPTFDPEISNFKARIYLELRDYTAALKASSQLPGVYEAQYETISQDLSLGKIHLAMGQVDLAKEDFTRAEFAIGEKLKEKPGAGSLVAGHAVALAGMGRSDEALIEIDRSMKLYPASKDPWIQTYRIYDKAYIQMLAGQPEAAVQTLSELMQRQTDVISPAILGSSPIFDPLRGRDDFKALLAEVS